jgi:tRNA(Ile)-lysidine synthase
VSAADARGAPVAGRELGALFRDFQDCSRILLAVSGGPDSTALLLLAARWRDGRGNAPRLIAATVDHRLRRESKAEAETVAKLARRLRVPHSILTWSGRKPKTGLPEAARGARYALLAGLARAKKADAIVTAHSEDDQAETMLHRIGRGSGLKGLAGIRARSMREGIVLLRPLLGVPKARLIATVKKAGVEFAEDPTNADPRFLRPRLRKLAPELAKEGISAARLALLARRLARADAAIEAAVEEGFRRAALRTDGGLVEYDARTLFALPAEIGLRLMGRAADRLGHEGPVELGKLEALHAALERAWHAGEPLKRTLAGAVVRLDRTRLAVEPAPRRGGGRKRHEKQAIQRIR